MNTTCFIEEKSKGGIIFKHDLIIDCLCFFVIFFLSSGFLCVLALSTYGRKIAILVPLPQIYRIYGPEQRDNFCSSIPRRNPEIQYD